jgi:D-3-phosphoglycerate dehydrogenase
MPTPPRIVVYDRLTEEFAEKWQEDLAGLPAEVLFAAPSDDRTAVADSLRGARVIITTYAPVDRAVLDAAGKSLTHIIKLSRWPLGIDLDACRARSIHIELVPQYGRISVAEHAMAMVLACARALLPAHRGVAAGEYRRYALTPAITSERSFAPRWLPAKPCGVFGRTLGIVGMGEIGRELAVRARSFGMTLLAYDLDERVRSLAAELSVTFCALPELLASSDFVSLHVPHSPHSEGLIGAGELALMKESAFLINCARGGLIDEAALTAALKQRAIAGAGLDVFIVEPLPFDSPLCTLDNVLLTPHIGGASTNGRAEVASHVRELVLTYLQET